MTPHRTARALLPWLLPWLLARLLVPSGLMPVAPGGEPGWILCADVAALAEPASPSPSRGGGGQHADAPCLCAAAGASAPPPEAALPASRIAAAAAVPIPADSGPAWPVRPARAHPARGPPLFS